MVRSIVGVACPRKPLTRDQAANLTSTGTHGELPYFRIFMPYLFQRVEYLGIKNVYLPLNRDYMPIGVRRIGSVHYADHIEASAVRFPRDAATYADLWHYTSGGDFWLYDDSSASRMDYFERLARLLSKGLPLIDPESPSVRRMKRETEDRVIRRSRRPVGVADLPLTRDA